MQHENRESEAGELLRKILEQSTYQNHLLGSTLNYL